MHLDAEEQGINEKCVKEPGFTDLWEIAEDSEIANERYYPHWVRAQFD